MSHDREDFCIILFSQSMKASHGGQYKLRSQSFSSLCYGTEMFFVSWGWCWLKYNVVCVCCYWGFFFCHFWRWEETVASFIPTAEALESGIGMLLDVCRPCLGFILSAHPVRPSTAAGPSPALWRNWRSAALWASPSRSCAGTPGSGSVPAWSVPLCRRGCLESATPRRISQQTPHAAGRTNGTINQFYAAFSSVSKK